MSTRDYAADGAVGGAGEAGGAPTPPPRLLPALRAAARARHYSPRTEEAYAAWVRRYVRFHGGARHPRDLGPADVARFLSHLATAGRVSASTQNQARAALLFLYREVLDRPAGELEGVVRARRPHRLPAVLTRTRCGPSSAAWAGPRAWWRRCSTAAGCA